MGEYGNGDIGYTDRDLCRIEGLEVRLVGQEMGKGELALCIKLFYFTIIPSISQVCLLDRLGHGGEN